MLRQIAREAELRQCFRDEQTVLRASIDNLQLQNCELKQGMDAMKVTLDKEIETKKSVAASLAVSESKLSQVTCAYERLQCEFASRGDENKRAISKILNEKDDLNERLAKVKVDHDKEISELKIANEQFQEQSRYSKPLPVYTTKVGIS